MFYSERHKRLLEFLQNNQSATVHRLAKEFAISESSIRRDLANLESMGKIRRTFGGAVFNDAAEPEVSMQYRRTQNVQAKKQIAQQAVKHVHDGMMIFLDASSTAAQIIPLLAQFKDLTVVTNSPQAAVTLGEMQIRCLCTGGKLLNQSMAFVGSHAKRCLEALQADIAFFSCRGFANNILSDSLEDEVELRQAMLHSARKKIFLCDTSKLGKSYPYRLCLLEDLDEMITE